MKRLYPFFVLLFAFSLNLKAQDLYFPPTTGDTWETSTFTELGWCEENLPALCTYLEDKNTKAFIVLKDGKIAIEKYFGTFEEDSLWYWASAGKTLTAMLVGIAQEEGHLNIEDKTSDYLGTGWTSLPLAQENNISIWNQLTMTSGLNDEDVDVFCTDPECLIYEAEPGERWAYHNGPYTLLDEVVTEATGTSLNVYNTLKIKNKTGMDGIFLPVGYNNVYFSKARSFARYGLLMLNNGSWEDESVLGDATYYNEQITTSQDLNKSYGYLWWLNGKESFMLPGAQTVFDGELIPNAPADMYSALGKNGQYINIVPSQNLVMIRIGNSPDGIEALVPTIFNNTIWDLMNAVMCESSTITENKNINSPTIYPNPSLGTININTTSDNSSLLVYDNSGRLLLEERLLKGNNTVNTFNLSAGTYPTVIIDGENRYTKLLVIE